MQAGSSIDPACPSREIAPDMKNPGQSSCPGVGSIEKRKRFEISPIYFFFFFLDFLKPTLPALGS